MVHEKDFENIICKYPELIEEGLILKGRQVHIYGRIMDLLFEDRYNSKLIIELKAGPIKDSHIGQVLSYEGMILSAEDPTIRVMLVGTRVPPNIQRSLDHHGIAWREIRFSQLRSFLEEKNDKDFIALFEESDSLAPVSVGEKHKDISNLKDMGSSVNTYNISKIDISIEIPRNWIYLDQTNYTIDFVFEKRKTIETVKRIAYEFHSRFAQNLQNLNLRWYARTNICGISYSSENHKTFMWLNILKNFVSAKYYTGDSQIEGILKANWITGDDYAGSETFRIKDASLILKAVDFGIKAYIISLKNREKGDIAQ